MNVTKNNSISVSLLNRKIYSVCYPPYDTVAAFHDTLYGARRRFLEKGKTAKVRETGIYSGLSGEAEGMLSRRKLKWKKQAAGHILETFFVQHKQRGIAFYNPGDILRCRIYFDRDQQWVRSEYFLPEDPLRAKISFKPDPTKDAVLRFSYNSATGTTKETVLLPVPYALQTAEQSLQNARFGEDFFLVSTDSGDFAYCPKSEQQQRLQFLDESRDASVMLSMGWEVRDGDITPPDAAPSDTVLTLPENTEQEDDLFKILTIEETAAEESLEEAAAEIFSADGEDQPSEAENEAVEISAPEAGPSVEESSALGFSTEELAFVRGVLDRLLEKPTVLEPAAKENEPEAAATLVRSGDIYTYTGEMDNGSREGFGRTLSTDGITLYEGEYKNDKRDGFGAHHYRSGAMSYIGDFKDDERDGFGISFRESDHAMHLSRWKDGKPEGHAALFDPNGTLRFAGKIIDGQKQGAGVSIDTENDTVFIAKYENNEPTGEGALFAGDGTLLYVGNWLDGKRHGHGTEFDRNGDIVYSGEWKDDKYENGILYKKVNGKTEDGSN